MKPIILTADPNLQKVVKFHDLNDGRFAVDTEFNVEGILDYNADVRAVNKTNWKGENLVGRIPMPIWQALQYAWKAMNLSKAERHAALLRFLSDPDNAKFKVKSGRL
jgi:hypothetical protein